jgi:hypothetical protein
MKIQVTITTILDDKLWGFSDLLEERSINEETTKEILELLNEDISEVLSEATWKIETL